MKHAEIKRESDGNAAEKTIYVNATETTKLCLVEKEYTQEELDRFNDEAPKWILRRSGTQYFLADSDSGEDARGYYWNHFEIDPRLAVFEKGEFIGFYLCAGNFNYSGLSRSSFDIDKWGYPGDNPFEFISAGNETHLFLFSLPESFVWKDWDLLVRDPKKEYGSGIDFR